MGFIVITTLLKMLGIKVADKASYVLIAFQLLVLVFFVALGIGSVVTADGAGGSADGQSFFDDAASFTTLRGGGRHHGWFSGSGPVGYALRMTTSTFVSSGVPVPGNLLRDVRRLLLLLHSVWSDQSASGVYLGLEAENLFGNLLNVAFDRGFTNLNKLKTNFPAVDLTSKDRRLAVQVTLTLDKGKAAKTQKKFFELSVPDGLLDGYDELWVVGLDLHPRRPLKAWEPKPNVRWESMSSILQLEDRTPAELQSMVQTLHQFLGITASKSPTVEESIERIVHFIDRRAISEFSDRENDWDECIRVVDAITFLVHNGYKTFSDHRLEPVMWTMPLPDLPKEVQEDLRVILRQLHSFRAEIKATKPRYGEKATVIDIERLKLQALVNNFAEKYSIPKPFPHQNLVTP